MFDVDVFFTLLDELMETWSEPNADIVLGWMAGRLASIDFGTFMFYVANAPTPQFAIFVLAMADLRCFEFRDDRTRFEGHSDIIAIAAAMLPFRRARYAIELRQMLANNTKNWANISLVRVVIDVLSRSLDWRKIESIVELMKYPKMLPGSTSSVEALLCQLLGVGDLSNALRHFAKLCSFDDVPAKQDGAAVALMDVLVAAGVNGDLRLEQMAGIIRALTQRCLDQDRLGSPV
jgi:hypothetical protein